jgi:two-component system response regulator FixJ
MTRVPTVFVVDDDAFMRDLLGRILPSAGIPVRTFASAFDVLAEVDFRSPCVLLLDVQMPGMTGPQLQAELRVRGVDVPIIFLTASADVPMAVAAMREGAIDFLEKPFHTDTLIARVQQTLARLDAEAAPAARGDYGRRLATLTPREREVHDLMVTGQTSKVIAREIGGSFRTIEIHRVRIMNKMAAANLADLVRMRIEAGAASPRDS